MTQEEKDSALLVDATLSDVPESVKTDRSIFDRGFFSAPRHQTPTALRSNRQHGEQKLSQSDDINFQTLAVLTEFKLFFHYLVGVERVLQNILRE